MSDSVQQSSVRRTRPEDVPFSPTPVTDLMVRSWADSDAFAPLDADYRQSPRFHKLLRTHARRVNYKPGGVIIREGDWGNSAFFIRSGTVAIELEPPGKFLPEESFGRLNVDRKSFWSLLFQPWTNSRIKEFRRKEQFTDLFRSVQAADDTAHAHVVLRNVGDILDRYETAMVGKGEYFGELAALGRMARTATVFAVEPDDGQEEVELLEIRWQGLRDLIRSDAGFQQDIDRRFRRNALKSFLLSSDLFAHLETDEAAIKELINHVELLTHGQYDRVSTYRDLASENIKSDIGREPAIALEGSYSNGIILIRCGVARVSQTYHQGHRTLNYLVPGGVFGFDEIAESANSGLPISNRYSLRAIGYLMGVLIPTKMVEKFVLNDARSSWAQQQSKSESRRRRKHDTAGSVPQLDENLLEFFVQERFVNGTETMLINIDRCTRCDECVKACAVAHSGNPRFIRQGSIHDNIMVTQACMHCRDPVCMIECPTGAISRRTFEGEVTINDQTCIGCGACSRNCPYGAITMVEVKGVDGKFLRDEMTGETLMKATKCDLCVEQLGGPACQRSCPHDALVRIDMSQIEQLEGWVHR